MNSNAETASDGVAAVVRAGQGVSVRWGPAGLMRIMAGAASTEGSFSVCEVTEQPGSAAPLHVHHADMVRSLAASSSSSCLSSRVASTLSGTDGLERRPPLPRIRCCWLCPITGNNPSGPQTSLQRSQCALSGRRPFVGLLKRESPTEPRGSTPCIHAAPILGTLRPRGCLASH